MTGYTVTQIEDAVITVLKNDVNISTYIKTVDRMPVENKILVNKLIFQYPAILVIYAGGTDNTEIYPVITHTGKFTLWCVDKSTRKISSASVGVYQMLNDVQSALFGNKLGLNIIDTMVNGSNFINAEEKITIYAKDFDIIWRYE